jgi:hypothetical protein
LFGAFALPGPLLLDPSPVSPIAFGVLPWFPAVELVLFPAADPPPAWVCPVVTLPVPEPRLFAAPVPVFAPTSRVGSEVVGIRSAVPTLSI